MGIGLRILRTHPRLVTLLAIGGMFKRMQNALFGSLGGSVNINLVFPPTASIETAKIISLHPRCCGFQLGAVAEGVPAATDLQLDEYRACVCRALQNQ